MIAAPSAEPSSGTAGTPVMRAEGVKGRLPHLTHPRRHGNVRPLPNASFGAWAPGARRLCFGRRQPDPGTLRAEGISVKVDMRPSQDESLERLRQRLRDLEHRAEVLEHPAVPEVERRAAMAELLARESDQDRPPPLDSPSWRMGRLGSVGPGRREQGVAPSLLPAIHGVAELKAHHQKSEARTEGEVIYVASAQPSGVDLSLRYEDGVLVRAVLSNVYGMARDVTEAVRTVRTVPLRLRRPGSTTESRATKPSHRGFGPSTLTPTPPYPPVLEVLARAVIRTADLAALDRARVDAGEPPYVLPEGAVAHSLAASDPRVAAVRPLRVLAVEAVEAPGIDSWWQMLGALKSWGFAIMPLTWRCKGLQEVLDFVAALQQAAPSFEIALEGGTLTHHRPPPEGLPRTVRLAFPPVGRVSAVDKIYHAVSRTGTLLPVVQLGRAADGPPLPERAPVPASAAGLVSLRPGQSVRVRPGGVAPAVVPEVLSPVGPEPTPGCPSCTAPPRGGLHKVCASPRCPGRDRALLAHLAGPRGLRLPSLSPDLIDRLLAERGPLDLPAVLGLDGDEIDRMAPGAGARFAAERAEWTRLAGWRVLYWAGIRQLGERGARLVLQQAFSLGRLFEMRPSELLDLEGVEPGALEALLEWLRGPGPDFLARLRATGVDLLDARAAFPAPFCHQRVVVDGRFAAGAHHIVDEIERKGGRVEPRVNRTTDFVVLGERADRTRDAAAVYALPVLDETAWQRLVEAFDDQAPARQGGADPSRPPG